MLKKFTGDFTITPNEIIDHPKMSLKSKGIWTWLNSKPQNWNFSVKGMTKQNKDGEDGITSGMKELEKFRYLKRVPRKDGNGQWNGYDYHLFDKPFEITDEPPVGENPDPAVPGKSGDGKTGNGKTGDGKSPTLNNTILNKNELNKTNETNGLFGNTPIPDLPTEILNYLNEVRETELTKNGGPKPRGFSDTASNLSDIKSRIKEKFKIDDFKKVIDYKVQEWNKPEMEKYIRPSTLFGKKFNEYLIQAERQKPKNDGSNNFKFNPTEKAEMK